MKTHLLFAALISLFFLPVLAGAAPEEKPKAPVKTEDGSIQATIVAVNRGFGFLIANAGSKHGVKKGMTVSITRDKKRVAGILRIGEIEEESTVLEYFPGKSDPRDRITEVFFSVPGAEKK